MAGKKLDFIDALRGIAASYVALFHLQYITFPNARAPDWLKPFADGGMSGVSLFFIVSAFTLCLSADARRSEPSPVLSYYLRRLFRIAPLYYVWLAISCFRDYTMLNSIHPHAEVLSNIFFVFNFNSSTVNGIPWAGWTIGVEMAFYVVFPAIFTIINSLKRSLVLLLVTTAIGLLWRHHFPDDQNSTFGTSGFLSRLPIFVLGVTVYHVYRELRAHRPLLGYVLMGASAAWFVWVSYHYTFTNVLPLDYQQAACWATLVLGLSIAPIGLLVNSLTRFLGTISYSIYLTHATAWHLMSLMFVGIYTQFGGGAPSFLISYAIGMCFVANVARLSYLFIEQPGIRFGSKVIRWARSGDRARVTSTG